MWRLEKWFAGSDRGNSVEDFTKTCRWPCAPCEHRDGKATVGPDRGVTVSCFYSGHKDVSYRGFTIGFITHFCFFMLAKCSSNVILLAISCTIILSYNFASLIFLSHLLAILAFLKIWPVSFSDYMCISVLNELPSCPYP